MIDWPNIAVTPIVAAIVGLGVWFVQSRIERLRAASERLHDDRRQVYTQILDPYVRLWTNPSDPQALRQALKQLQSFEYRKIGFEFSLIASDDVLRAFNDMMQFFYNDANQGDPSAAMRQWGGFLLALRRSVGNPKTELSEFDMLRGIIKDIDQLTDPSSRE